MPVLAKAPVMSGSNWAMLLILSVLWGGTFFFAKIALASIPPLTLVLARVSLGALGLLVYMRLSGVAIAAGPKVWAAFFGMGLLNNVLPFCLIFWGQSHLPAPIAASLASILNATTPVFGVIIAHFLTADEKLNPARMAGVLLGLGGVALILAPGLAGQELASPAGYLPAGMLACLTAAAIYGFAGIFGRRFKDMGVQPLQTAFGQLAASTTMMIPLALVVDQPWNLPVPGLVTLAAIAGLALISTSIAYVLYFRILATAGATNLLLVTFLIPVSAILLGTLLLNEHLQGIHLAGMALIGLGLAAIDGRLAKRVLNR